MDQSVYQFRPEQYKSQLESILSHLDTLPEISDQQLQRALKKFPKDGTGYFKKSELITGFSYLAKKKQFNNSVAEFAAKLKKKPVRTMSGVTPVTVLTKPFPCPGKCIFCPNDVRMPKSYLSDEPGAQRAARNSFDPYLQTYNRIVAFSKNGHSIDKIELIILGGTWSFYPEEYQIWFIKRCFDAMNDYGSGVDGRAQVKLANDFTKIEERIDGEEFSKTYNVVVSKELVTKQHGRLLNDWEHATWEELEMAQKINEKSHCRNVGLVIETRPDHISEAEIIRIRRLGCTKTQIGFQSLSDSVLDANKRGHDVAATRRAMKLLRAAGFKIHAHWMANLYGSSPQEDIDDYKKVFSHNDFKPDELKIYPCSLIQTAELMQYYKKGLWKPYTHDELLKVVVECIKSTPQYCRLTRIIRDIPSTDIVDGNKMTNFRQLAEQTIERSGVKSNDIRSREIKNQTVDPKKLRLDIVEYETSVSSEKFLQYVTPEYKIVGFLRLSLPKESCFIDELKDAAIIREVHVYGIAANIGEKNLEKSQHLGLGSKLISKAKELAIEAGFSKIAVISAIGTREYYRKQGFSDGTLYQHMDLKS